jgi:hypothetical protein
VGGGCRIRTCAAVTPTTVFETAALPDSANPPCPATGSSPVVRGGRADRTRAGTSVPDHGVATRCLATRPALQRCPSRGRTSVSGVRFRRPCHLDQRASSLPVQGSNLGSRLQRPLCCLYTNRDRCPYQDSNLDWPDSESGASTVGLQGQFGIAFSAHAKTRGRGIKENRPGRFPDGRLPVMTSSRHGGEPWLLRSCCRPRELDEPRAARSAAATPWRRVVSTRSFVMRLSLPINGGASTNKISSRRPADRQAMSVDKARPGRRGGR